MDKVILIIIIFILLIICILLIRHIKKLNTYIKHEHKLTELEKSEFSNVATVMKYLREVKHDLEFHLNTIKNLISNEQLDELNKYVDTYKEKLDSFKNIIYTGNIAVDCVVSDKLIQAKEKGIDVCYQIIIHEDFSMDVISLSSLLGNLWQNAIDASENLLTSHSELKPYIKFLMLPHEKMMHIHIENNYDGKIQKKAKEKLMTTKSGKGHGIGLIRVNDIVEKEDGIMKIDTNNSVFKVNIVLPIREK